MSFGDMKARISNELERSDLGSFIPDAIYDAIKTYERRRYWFNESRDLTFNTVAGQRIYTTSDAAWIPTTITIDHLFITVGGQRRCLSRRDAADIELLADNSALQGEPYCWAYWNKSIQLYPIPQQEYEIRAYAHIRLPQLVDDSDENAWTEEAEAMIRQAAKALLCSEVTMDDAAASRYGSLAEMQENFIREENSRRLATGCVTPTSF